MGFRRRTMGLWLFLTLAASWACGTSGTSEDRAVDKASHERAAEARADHPRGSPTGGLSDAAPPKPPIDPLEAPRAYFGELPLERPTGSVDVRPAQGSSVVLIVIDALNAKHLGIYGYHRETSPFIDGLARRGLLLSNYVSNSSWTRPSFTTMITGQPKRVHKIEWHGGRLDSKITTVAERFGSAGYATGAVIGNQLVKKMWGFGQGFRTYKDVKSLNQVFPRDRLLADKAIDWLKTTGDKPFFLMVFLIDPHTPYRPLSHHRQFLDSVSPGPVTRYPYREYRIPMPKAEHDRVVAAYDGEVHSADSQVGRIIEYLTSSGRDDDTSIVVTADHGEAFGDHNCYTHAYHMWDSVLRVPFVLVSPALSKGGIVDDRPFTHIDLAPTLLDLAGIAYGPDGLPGMSIVKALGDPAANRQRILFSQYNAHGVRRQAIRKGRWKLIHHHKVKPIALQKLNEFQLRKPQPDPRTLPSLTWDRERYEFYDLKSDPQEMKDLSASKAGAAELAELKSALMPCLDVEIPKGEITEEMTRALENIGYIARTTETTITAEQP